MRNNKVESRSSSLADALLRKQNVKLQQSEPRVPRRKEYPSDSPPDGY